MAGGALAALGSLWWRAWARLLAGDAGVLCVPDVTLGDIHLRFAWHAWHLATSTFASWQAWHLATSTWHCTLHYTQLWQHFGSRQKKLTWLWWRAWARIVARGAAPLCVAGVALGDIHLRFAWHAWHLATSTFASWQAWHLATSTFVLRGRRGTCGIGLALVVRLGADSRQGRRATLRGRRGTW